MTAEWIRKRYKFIYLLFQELLLLGICLFGLGYRIGIGAPLGFPLAAGVLSVFLLTWILDLRPRERLFAFLALAGCMLLAALAAGEGGAAFFASYRIWLTDGEAWNPEWQSGYEVMQAVLAAVLCCLFGRLTDRFLPVRAALAGVLAALLAVSLFGGLQTGHAGAVLALWYGVMTAAEYVRLRWEKRKEADAALYTVWLLPVGLFFLVLMLMMPSPQEAYDWAFVKAAYGRIRESVITHVHSLVRGGGEDFVVSFQGFSEDGGLGGDLRKESRELFRIESDSLFRTNLYLAGASYDRFDGREWEKTCHEEEPWRVLDAAETVSAVQAWAQTPSDHLWYTQFGVSYGWFRTGYLFAPLKTRTIQDTEYENDGGDLRFGMQRGYGTSYRIGYYQINTGAPDFYELLESGSAAGGSMPEAAEPSGAETKAAGQETGSAETEAVGQKTGSAESETAGQETGSAELEDAMRSAKQEELETLLADYGAQNRGTQAGELTPEDMERYRENVRANYGEGVRLSPGVKSWLDQVLDGAETDVEKLRALEYALSALKYTQTPGALPERVKDAGSFLDHFLLETGRGYCSYFATAFVLLARSQGIPARYVEGFCVPARQKRSVTVTSDMTHAWPEVWLEGFGWIPFEPTPGFRDVRYTPWKTSGGARADDFAAPKATLPARPDGQEADPDTDGETADEEADGVWMDRRAVWGRILRTAGAGLAVLLGCLLAALWADRAVRSRRFARMGLTERFLYVLRQDLWLLSLLGLVRGETETLQEFRERCGKTLETEGPASLAFYEELRYGDKAVPDRALEAALREREELLSRIRDGGRLRYWLARFRLGG